MDETNIFFWAFYAQMYCTLSRNFVAILNDICYETFVAGKKNAGDLMVAGFADQRERRNVALFIRKI
jgi:hypothetical protein